MRKSRKQRVTLRFKHREVLKHRLRRTLVRSATVALVIGFGAGIVVSRGSFVAQFFIHHTPQVVLDLPVPLANLPVLQNLPQNSYGLWIPGSELYLQTRLSRKYPAIRSVRLERLVSANRMVVHVHPRVPLVSWNGSGMDQDGVLFAIQKDAWPGLPAAVFLPDVVRPDLGHWLARMAAVPQLWSQVNAIRQDPYGSIELTLKTGAVVIWGNPETTPAPRKLQTVVRVLDDAHAQLGGAARADLRFFDQGRIIVRPKSSR